ncbi:MAG: pyridoxamine 5'-phosphate oxidase [Candidatus Sumerlaeia bacterium]|nr:pyridoxamine 5'-phosphate oxidase [Candidatus Sumerlaeia bacterium]
MSKFSIPVLPDPFELFRRWFSEAIASESKYPDAVALASVDESGMPSVRTVLMKEWDDRGFVFYTNLDSRKGREILAAGKAAMCFYWKSLDRQVRIHGAIEIVSDEQADAYFASRHPESRLGAWASHQSEEISGRGDLIQRLEDVRKKYEGKEIPRPPHWSGIRILPDEIEFWQEGEFRLHDRLVYTHEGAGWRTRFLSP